MNRKPAVAVLFLSLLLLLSVSLVRANRAPEELVKAQARVEGVVVDENGKPVGGTVVNCLGTKGGTVDAKTDRNGKFVLEIEAPTLRYVILLASADGGARQGLYEFGPTLDFTTETPIRITLKPSLSVTVHVADAAGTAVSGAAVEVFHQYAPVAHARTVENGAAVMRYPANANIRWIVAFKSGMGFDYFENYAAWPPAWDARRLLAADVKLVLDGARRVSVGAVDSADKPVPDIGFVPWSIKKPGKLSSANLSGSEICVLKTDVNGTASFDWIPKNFERGIQFLVRGKDYHCPRSPRLENQEKKTEFVARLFRSTRIDGKVLLPDGKPAVGVLVQAEGRGATNNYCRMYTRTAADGSYRMLVYPHQSYIVAVTDKDWAALSHIGIVVREDQPRENLDFQLTKGTMIRGKVTIGPDRKPNAKATVGLIQEGAPVPEGLLPDELAGRSRPGGQKESLVRWAETDENGLYELRVGAGEYRLQFGNIKAEMLKVGTQKDVVRDFHEKKRPRVTLTGVIMDGRDPAKTIPGAVVHGMFAPFFGLGGLKAVADKEGRFAFKRRQDKMVVYAKSPDGKLAGFVKVFEEDRWVEISLFPAATAEGRLLDEKGNPIPNQRVQCNMGYLPRASGRSITLFAKSDEQGFFSFAGLLVGVQVSIRPHHRPDQTVDTTPFKIEEAGAIALDDLVIRPAPRVKGVVYWDAGGEKTVAGAIVRAISIREGRGRSYGGGGAGTDKNGQFTIYSFSGRMLLYARNRDNTRAGLAEVLEHEDHDNVKIHLAPTASVTGTIMDEFGKPLPKQRVWCAVRAMGRTGTPLMEWCIVDRGVITDNEGAFFLSGLPVGQEYTLEVRSPREEPRLRSVHNAAQFKPTEAKTIKLPDIIIPRPEDAGD